MQLSVLEPFREPRGPTGGHVFDGLDIDSALQRFKGWSLTGKTLFKFEDSSDRWMTFETDGSGEFESSFQSAPGTWHIIIGSTFNAEACAVLAQRFFAGDESQLQRYALDTRAAAKKWTDSEIRAALDSIEEQPRKWWQFWR